MKIENQINNSENIKTFSNKYQYIENYTIYDVILFLIPLVFFIGILISILTNITIQIATLSTSGISISMMIYVLFINTPLN